MVVIIDDRADVWDRSPNLVKVIPCQFFADTIEHCRLMRSRPDEFFVGIGDINAAFLPKRKELVVPSAVGAPSSSPIIAIDPDLDVYVFEEGAATATVVPSLSEATASTAIMLQDQIENRPLSHNKIHHPHTHHASPSDPIEEHGLLELATGLVGMDGDSTDEDEGEAVLRDDDRELERVFAVRSP